MTTVVITRLVKRYSWCVMSVGSGDGDGGGSLPDERLVGLHLHLVRAELARLEARLAAELGVIFMLTELAAHNQRAVGEERTVRTFSWDRQRLNSNLKVGVVRAVVVTRMALVHAGVGKRHTRHCEV